MLPCIKKLAAIPGVDVSQGDQCQYGAEARSGPRKGSPVMKPTKFMSNSPKILEALSLRCQATPVRSHDGMERQKAPGYGGTWCSRPVGGRHAVCAGGICRAMAEYPRGLCKAVFRGVVNPLKDDRRITDGCYGTQVSDANGKLELYRY